ncbi:hypothetical protein ACTFIR_007560 [Dictyostelium discoideum]
MSGFDPSQFCSLSVQFYSTSIRSNPNGSVRISPEPSNEQPLNNQNECTPPRRQCLDEGDEHKSKILNKNYKISQYHHLEDNDFPVNNGPVFHYFYPSYGIN